MRTEFKKQGNEEQKGVWGGRGQKKTFFMDQKILEFQIKMIKEFAES